MKRYWTTQDQVDNQSVPGIYDEKKRASQLFRDPLVEVVLLTAEELRGREARGSNDLAVLVLSSVGALDR